MCIGGYSALLIGYISLLISKDLSHDDCMGIVNPKIRLIAFLLINLIVILAFRYWVLNNESFAWLLNGLPS